MDMQYIFYLVATISLGLMAIFMVFLVGAAVSIAAQVKRVLRRIEDVGEQVATIAENVRGYSEQLGVSVAGRIVNAIVHALAKKPKRGKED